MELERFSKFKSDNKYYNGNELLSKTDRNGKKPEIFISTSNRSAGKTTWFGGYLLNKFLKNNELFCIVLRKKYQLEKGVSYKAYFPSALTTFFPDLEMKEEIGIKSVFNHIYIRLKGDDSPWFLCGYSTSINASDDVRNFSNMFENVRRIWFDEFQPESGEYVKDEVKKLFSIHTSLARGNGSQSRYLPLIMTGNLIDLFNPYYDALNVIKDLNIEAKFYRGNGFVIEQGFNENASIAHEKSTFNQAFENVGYNKVLTQKEYLNTNYNMIIKVPNLKGDYLFTLKHNNVYFSVRYLNDIGIYYVSESVDKSNNLSLACTKDDMTDDCIFDGENRFCKLMKKRYHMNNVRFSGFKAREAFLEFIR